MEGCSQTCGSSRSRGREDGSDGDLLELAAAVLRHREAQIHDPVDMVSIRDEVAASLGGVVVQNLFDGREARDQLSVGLGLDSNQQPSG